MTTEHADNALRPTTAERVLANRVEQGASDISIQRETAVVLLRELAALRRLAAAGWDDFVRGSSASTGSDQ